MKTKDTVLAELSKQQNSNTFISGQELASLCGISRQAVWKAVKSLQKDGAKIQAITNKGYRLENSNALISEDAILSLISKSLGVKVFVYDTIDSTNSEAKRMCADSNNIRSLNGTVLIAKTQTAGRGRVGRKFYSQANTGIYLSIIYSPDEYITSPAILTALAAVGVCRSIFSVYGIQSKIKWVNDIFINDKKVCGILTEGISNFETGLIECAIVGIGVNILPSNMPEEIASLAGSVLTDANADTKRNELAASIISNILSMYASKNFSSLMNEYRERSLLINKTVNVFPIAGNTLMSYKAKVVEITDDAKLVVTTKNGQKKILESGEVSIAL